MAAREHRVSRRVLLGAACGCAFAGPAGAFPSSSSQQRLGSTQRWNRALAACQHAEAVLDAAIHEPDEDLYGDLVVAFNRTLRTLLRTPAPDLPALSVKLGLAVDHYAWELTGGEACMAALSRDARLLAFPGSS